MAVTRQTPAGYLRMGSGAGGWTLVREGSAEEVAWRAGGGVVVNENGKPRDEPESEAQLRAIAAFARSRNYDALPSAIHFGPMDRPLAPAGRDAWEALRVVPSAELARVHRRCVEQAATPG